MKNLSFQNHPIQLFQFNGRTAFLASEVGNILGIKQPNRSLTASKTLEQGHDYDLAPASLLNSILSEDPNYESDSQFAGPSKYVLYDSGLFLFIMRSDSPIAAKFTRWVIREAIPVALEQSKNGPIEYSSKDVLSLMALEVKGSEFAKAELNRLGLSTGNQQLALPGGPNA